MLNGDQKSNSSELHCARLIHILAKHATPINASRTVLGRVPAMLSTLVIRTRSIAVLLRADAIVNPPINSMIVGENMTEKMYLAVIRVTQTYVKICTLTWWPPVVSNELQRRPRRYSVLHANKPKVTV